jgi:outer membrane protein TolC
MKALIHLLIVILLCSITSKSAAQSIRLDSCQIWAKEHFPLSRQLPFLQQSEQFSLANLEKGLWPQISVNGQATLQSDVTQLPIKLPGVTIPSLSKDQYKTSIDINQPITDFWVINQQKALIQGQYTIERNKTEVELYPIKQKVNQLFLGVILLQAQIELNNIAINDLQKNIAKTQAGINEGTAFGLQLNLLMAEKIKLEQRGIELSSARKQYIAMLSLFTGKTLSEKSTFVLPQFNQATLETTRPEIVLFNAQLAQISNQSAFLETRKLPKASLFVQSGYGRPTLNMLNNNFGFYGIGGLRFQWNISTWYTIKKEQEILKNSQRSIVLAQESFLLQNQVATTQSSEEVTKFDQLIASDQKAIALRKSIRTSLEAQWEQGIISTQDYLIQVSAEDQVKQNEVIHQIQKLMALAQIQFLQGQ